ncbi:hypothetical protein NLU13_5093 [Sarocladium strictum]|uniref:U1-type domain-containing protein n=1 Tax=Sarocladium strictum TaxID=5046 RepID=A0AA39L9F8_SARSR|nr:hypothetical protein NLU13_5093 [Sarocladium strictum]
MAEYWKSTERYWCKHCACYVRDTKLERQNHEATAKHQGALKRFLRDLHRGHEQEERNRERARQEIDRLNGITSGSSSGSRPSGASASATRQTVPPASDLKKQREQLAQMGVQMPETFRPEMAMPGEWTVTNTRVIETKSEQEKTEAKATGVRKREVTEEDKEEEDAVQSLFKKPRRWGRDSKAAQQGGDEDLDALLSGNLDTAKVEQDGEGQVKTEESQHPDVKEEDDPVKPEPDDSKSGIKPEPDEAGHGIDEVVKKEEDTTDASKPTEGESSEGAVVFKKRKPKHIRQR